MYVCMYVCMYVRMYKRFYVYVLKRFPFRVFSGDFYLLPKIKELHQKKKLAVDVNFLCPMSCAHVCGKRGRMVSATMTMPFGSEMKKHYRKGIHTGKKGAFVLFL